MIEHVFATADFPATSPAGARVIVRKGSHWPADDPIVQQHPESFSNDPRWGLQFSQQPRGWDDPPAESPVEQATRAPGERRQVRRGNRDSD